MEHVAGLGSDAEQRLVLALSEVVANAVRHGEHAEDDEISIAVEDGGTLRVTVEQPSATPAIVQPPTATEGGFGLRLVEDITDRWGADPGPPGRVWFEVRRGAHA